LHWVILWLGLAAFGLWRLLPAMGSCGRSYLVLVSLWGVVNFLYLSWFFGRRKSSVSVEQFLSA
ncbi:hypothetical protein EBX31_07975, partial [bacterium]|nr:hypothetical protein [bacterium]